METDTYDVAIVGYGPVGQLLSILLAQQGYRVLVVERHLAIYPLPRAVHLDDEVARILQAVDVRADTNPVLEPYDNWYEWRNADMQTLLKVDWRGVGPSWWHTSNFFSQPELERELDGHAQKYTDITLRRGFEAMGLDQDDDGVTLSIRPAAEADRTGHTEKARARYLVGCDGANSTVRQLVGLEVHDLGFYFDWLILDMIPDEPMTFDPPAWQFCDPARPTTIVPGGPGRRRWEFMALPGEDINDLNREDTAWELLAPWGLTADNSRLERHAVYRFQAHWAASWRNRRVLIAGDAAHLMPPFAGQGMCAGMRDAFNLVWKLDLVLKGRADDVLLDTYGPERSPHVRYFIDFSMELGRVICVHDEEAAAERDARMMAAIEDPALGPPQPPPPRLGAGALRRGDAHAGQLSIQSEVGHAGQQGLFDDVVGRGWLVLCRGAAATDLGLKAQALLDRLGGKVLGIGAPDEPGVEVTNPDGRYATWFAGLDADAVVVRPDFYIYAAVTGHDNLVAALEALDDDVPASTGSFAP